MNKKTMILIILPIILQSPLFSMAMEKDDIVLATQTMTELNKTRSWKQKHKNPIQNVAALHKKAQAACNGPKLKALLNRYLLSCDSTNSKNCLQVKEEIDRAYSNCDLTRGEFLAADIENLAIEIASLEKENITLKNYLTQVKGGSASTSSRIRDELKTGIMEVERLKELGKRLSHDFDYILAMKRKKLEAVKTSYLMAKKAEKEGLALSPRQALKDLARNQNELDALKIRMQVEADQAEFLKQKHKILSACKDSYMECLGIIKGKSRYPKYEQIAVPNPAQIISPQKNQLKSNKSISQTVNEVNDILRWE